jgi:hypothetical protein
MVVTLMPVVMMLMGTVIVHVRPVLFSVLVVAAAGLGNEM